MDSLELLTRYGHVDPADEAIIDDAAMAVLGAPDQSARSPIGGRWPRRTLASAVSVAAAAALVVTGISLAGTSLAPRPATGVNRPTAPPAGASSGHAVLARLASTVLAAPPP